MAESALSMYLRFTVSDQKARAAIDALTGSMDALNTSVTTAGNELGGFRDRIRGTDNVFTSLGEAAKSAAEQVDKVRQVFAPLNQAVLSAQMAMGGAIAMFVGNAVTHYQELEAAQISLTKLLKTDNNTIEEVTQQTSKYTEALKVLANQTGNTTSGLVQSMANWVQSGYQAEEAFQLVNASLNLMAAGELEATRASELLARTMAGFGTPMDEAAETATRLGDIWNEVANNFNTSVEQLAEGFARFSPIAAGAGLSLEETAGVLTPIIEVFGSGAEAAEGLKTGMLKLHDSTEDVTRAFSILNVSQKNIDGTFRSQRDILFDIGEAFQGLDDNTKGYVASLLSGINQSARMVQVFDNLGKITQVTAAATNSAGSAAAEAKVKYDSLTVAFARVAESTKNATTSLIAGYVPSIKKVVDAFALIPQAIDQAASSGAFAGLENAIKPHIESLSAFITSIAQNLPKALNNIDWSGFAAALNRQIQAITGAATETIDRFLGGVSISSEQGLTSLLQLIVNLGTAAMEYAAGYIKQITNTIWLLAPVTTNLLTVIADNPNWAAILGNIAGITQSIYTVLDLAGTVLTTIGSLLGGITSLVSSVALLGGGILLLSKYTGLNLVTAVTSAVTALGSMRLVLSLIPQDIANFIARLLGIPAPIMIVNSALLGLAGALGASAYAFTNWAMNATGARDGLGLLIADIVGLAGFTSRSATATELAAEAQFKQANAAAQAAIVARKLAEEQEAVIAASKKQREANERLIDAQNIKIETEIRLANALSESGKQWVAATGRIVEARGPLLETAYASEVVRAQFNNLGGEFDVFANRVTKAGDETILAFQRLGDEASANGVTISRALELALSRANNTAEVERLQEVFKELGVEGKLSADEIAAGMLRASERVATLTETVTVHGRAAKALGLDYEELTGQQTKFGAKAAAAFIDLTTNAKLTGREIETSLIAALKSVKTPADLAPIISHIKNLGDAGKLSGKEVSEAVALINRTISELRGNTDPLTRSFEYFGVKSVAALKSVSDESKSNFQQVIAAFKQGTIGIEEAGKAFLKYAEASIQASVASKEPIDPTLKTTAALLRQEDALTKLIEKYAELKGTDTGLPRITVEQEEAAAATYNHRAASEALAKAKQEEAKAQEEAANRAKENAEQMKAAGSVIDGVLNGWTAYLSRLSDGAVEAFQEKMIPGAIAAKEATSNSLDNITRHADQMSASLNRASTGVVGWATNVAAVGVDIERSFVSQARAAESLTARINVATESTGVSLDALRNLILAAERSKDQFTLLDKTRLDQLESAITGARKRVDELTAAARNAQKELAQLSMSLEKQLLEQSGRFAELERRRYAEQLAEIEQLHQRAGAASDAEYNRARNRATELHQQNLQEAREREAQFQREQQQLSNASSARTQNYQQEARAATAAVATTTRAATESTNAFGQMNNAASLASASVQSASREMSRSLQQTAYGAQDVLRGLQAIPENARLAADALQRLNRTRL